MLFDFAQDLDKKFDAIRNNPKLKHSKSAEKEVQPRPKIPVKAIKAIHDKSNNNTIDLGRGIEELLAEMALPEDVSDHLKAQYQNVQKHYANIRYYTKEQIRGEAVKLRGNKDSEVDFIIALMNKANKIVTGYEFRPAQILSILEFFREQGLSKFCQINTGEGKTTVTSAIAVIKALKGDTVDIITSNEVLAQDAIRERADFYALFNLSVAHNSKNQWQSEVVKDSYAHDIVYGTIGNFEFDYLRDLVQMSTIRGARKFGSLIIDEADNVVLDNATHVAKISGPTAGMEALNYVYINIWQELINAEQRLGLKDTELAKITIANKQAIKQQISQYNIINKSIVPKFLEDYVDGKLDSWVNNAIHARYHYHQNQHYIIDKKDSKQHNEDAEDSVIPLDVAVGVTQQNTIWTGLHPFIQIKHNLAITQDSLSSIFIANSEYIRLYKNNISGLTGTLGSKKEQKVIQKLYGANSTIMPPYKAGRLEHEQNLLVDDDKWLKAIANDAIDHAVNQGRATLVVFNSLQDVLELEAQLGGHANINVITYRDERDAYKIEEINLAGGIAPGTIVISTNIGGRGTDIRLSGEVRENGGLHECTTFIASSRILKQALGRAGRQGEPGTTKIIIKQQDAEQMGIKLKPHFSNQEIYNFVDAKNNQKIDKLRSHIESVKKDGEYFTEFAKLYTKAKSSELNHFILEDLKLQWALAFDEKNVTKSHEFKIKEVFSKFETAIEQVENYEHQFINPYFAIKYADFILATESDNKDESIDLSYTKAQSILYQSCIADDPELLYASNMKLFELTMSLAQRNELKRLVDVQNTPDVTKVKEHEAEYKVKAKEYLNQAQKALTDKIKYLEDIMSSENFSNIILPEEALNNNGANYMLKHLKSKHVALRLQLKHVSILSKLINDSGNSLVYIKAMHSLNELIEKIANKDLTKKISPEELMQINHLSEDCFYNLQTLTTTENHPKVQAAMNQMAAKFAGSALNLPSFTRIPSFTHDTPIGSGIFDIIKIIFSQEEKTSQANSESRLFDLMAFDFGKVIECLNILHRVSQYVAKEISQVFNNSEIFTGFTSQVKEQLEESDKKIADIKPKATIKAPKTSVPKELIKKSASKVFNKNSLGRVLEGSDLNKARDIEEVDAYFGKYTLDAIKNILKLRVQDAEIDHVKITNNDYSFIDRDSNNIQDLVGELQGFTENTKFLVPLSLSDKHAVGIICFIEHNKNGNQNNIKIYYIDPENNPIPTELEQIFKANQLEIEQLITEGQNYANCGPEVIENFMLYLTGERLSQEAAIKHHSRLVEQDLLKNWDDAAESQAKEKIIDFGNHAHHMGPESCAVELAGDCLVYDEAHQAIY